MAGLSESLLDKEANCLETLTDVSRWVLHVRKSVSSQSKNVFQSSCFETFLASLIRKMEHSQCTSLGLQVCEQAAGTAGCIAAAAYLGPVRGWQSECRQHSCGARLLSRQVSFPASVRLHLRANAVNVLHTPQHFIFILVLFSALHVFVSSDVLITNQVLLLSKFMSRLHFRKQVTANVDSRTPL